MFKKGLIFFYFGIKVLVNIFKYLRAAPLEKNKKYLTNSIFNKESTFVRSGGAWLEQTPTATGRAYVHYCLRLELEREF